MCPIIPMHRMQSIAPNLLTTERLILRQWQGSDGDAFARLNADPVVREFFPRVQPREESAGVAPRAKKPSGQRGWVFGGVGVGGAAPYVGLVGVPTPPGGRPCARS